MREIRARWLLERKTGKKILVTPKDLQDNPEYRNAINYIRLDIPVPPDTPDAIATVRQGKRRTNLKKPASKKKATVDKKAAVQKKADK